MRVLVVGGGAIGLVYARHLADGGARVTLAVRERQRPALGAVPRVVAVRGRRRREEAPVRVAAVVGRPEALETERFDQTWLCVPTDALDGALRTAARAADCGHVVGFSPGLGVRERIAAVVGRPRTSLAQVGMIAWQAPLEGSDWEAERGSPAGIAYVFPPLVATLFDGHDAAADAAVAALRRGGCPARRVDDVELTLARSSSMLLPQVAALETVGWSLARYARDAEAPALAVAACRAMLAAVAARTRTRVPPSAFLVRAPLVRLAARAVPHLAPFDVEAYLRWHFTKVGAQTRLILEHLAREAHAHGVDARAIETLRARLGAPRERA